MSGWRRETLVGVGLVLIAFVAHGRTLWNGFGWDDRTLALGLPAMESPDGWLQIWLGQGGPDYWPVTYTGFWIQRRFFGLNPLGYHAVNLALHAACVLLVWRILLRLGVAAAGWGAMLFAVHPTGVEAVAWIFQQKTLQATFWAFASILAFLNGRHPLSWACFALAMLAKTQAAFVPLLIPMLLWREGRLDWKSGMAVVPLLAILGIAGAIAVHFQNTRGIGDEGPLAESVWLRAFNAPRVAQAQLQQAILPLEPRFVQPRWEVSVARPEAWLPVLLWMVMLGAAARRRGSDADWGLTAVVAYPLILGPSLGLVDFYYLRFAWFADHYQYAALPVVTAGFMALANKLLGARGAAGIALGLALGAGALSWRHAAVFRDEHSLWTHVFRTRSDPPWIAWSNLAAAKLERGEVELAAGILREGGRRFPEEIRLLNDLGVMLERAGRRREAIALYRRAIARRPNVAITHNNLGAALLESGDAEGARRAWEAALKRKSDYESALLNLADLAAAQGRHVEAAGLALKAAHGRPWNGPLRERAAVSLVAAGRVEEAIEQLAWACRCRPDDARAWTRLGDLLTRLGRDRAALSCFARAATIDPGDPGVRQALERCHARLGTRYPERSPAAFHSETTKPEEQAP